MNPDDIKPVQYNYKSTTAFDDQFSYGFEAQEVGQLIPNAVLSVREVAQNIISCYVGGTEMLRVAQDGFYVRGVKVTQDDKEAERVYNAFKEFLVWAELNRR
jgi:hypothetical protein